MYRKILIVILAVALCLASLTGCKKSEPEIKTKEEYKAEAEKQINRENMESELELLEKSIEKDISLEQP